MRVPVRRLPQTRISEQQQGFARAVEPLNVTPITQAIEGFRDQLLDEQYDRQKFAANKRLMDEINELQLDFEERRRNPDISPIDFADTTKAAYEERHQALLAGLKAEGFDEEIIEDLDLRLGTVRQGFRERAVGHQMVELRGRAFSEVDNLVTSTSQYVSTDYNNYSSAESMLRESISLRPDLTETEREAKLQQGLGILRDTGGKAIAIQAPQLVIEKLDPLGLTAPYRAPSTATVATVPTPAAGSWQSVPTTVAAELGLDPVEVAAVISYETAGTFSPTIVGGKNNNHLGLIQFGKEEQRKYGITKTSTPEQWTAAILSFMRDRGFKKGMSLLDFYSTINAGSPGRYNASDGPGNTVRGHVEELLAEHKEKAAAWLGVGTSNEPVQLVDIPPSAAADSALTPVVPGNLPLSGQQPVENSDGTVSTVRTISIGTERGEVLIPTVIDGKVVSDEEAVAHYERTGENFGTFKTKEAATAYAQALSQSHDPRTGIPILDAMNGPERLQVLAMAREQLNKVNATRKAEMDVTIGNITAEALNNGGEIATPLPTQEDVLAVYGPVEGPQRWAQIQQSKDTGKAITTFRTQSAETIQRSLDAIEPKPGSPTYETELQIYQAAERAAAQLLAERQADPAAYALKYFPSVRAAIEKGTAQYYAEIDRVYETLGIDSNRAPLLTAEAARQITADYKIMNPAQKLQFMRENYTGMGEDRFRRFVSNMEGTTAQEDARIYMLMRTYGLQGQGWAPIYQQVLEGREVMAKDPARRPPTEKLNEQFRTEALDAINRLNSDASASIQEAAAAIYVARNGNPVDIDRKLYQEALATALGGSLPVYMGSGETKDFTILPPRTNEPQFRNWIERQTFETLTHMSVDKRPPRYGDLKTLAQTEDIVDHGTFVMVAPGQYMIYMSTDGKPLVTSKGRPFVVNIRTQDILNPGNARRPPPNTNPGLDSRLRR